MPFDKPTEKALEAMKATQFGGSKANPQSQNVKGGNKPYSIAHSIRYLAGATLTKDNTDLSKNLPEEFTAAQLMAMNIITKAINGDARAVEICLERVDGKVVQPTQEIPLQTIPDDFNDVNEAAQAYNDIIKNK